MREAVDVLVVGAGIFGLWIARAAATAGQRVILAEQERPGAGASGGPLGALTPHMPERWGPLQAFQLAGLTGLADRLSELTAETGLPTGYARAGRVTPLRDEAARRRAERQMAAAQTRWGEAGRLELLDRAPPEIEHCLDPDAAPAGFLHDTLSARVAPRALVSALAASVSHRAEIRTPWRLTSLDPDRGLARFGAHEIAADRIVIAAGWESFALLGETLARAGRGVKGQAAFLAATLPGDMPVVQGSGLFIVPHGTGRIAIGSTSEQRWTHGGPDGALDHVIEAARALCPPLRDAPVTERWAGIRPRGPASMPIVGPLPGHGRIILASGGYKISFGIGHLVGDAVAALITGAGTPETLPPAFDPAAQLDR